MKERIFIFDKFDKLLAITNQYVEAVFEETVEKPVSFSITFPMSDKNAAYFVGGNQVAFKDLKGNLRLFTIREVDDIDGESPEKVIECMPAIQELADVMVANGELENEAADAALGVILKHSRWKVGNVADLGLNSLSFAYQNAYACIGKLVELWGGEIVDRVEIAGNKISCRYLDIVPRKGADAGKRFEMDKDIKNITRTVLYYPKTALYGQGKSLQSGEGSSDKVTFRNIEWKKENGDPTNKPKGQEWVGDPDALEKHGVPNHETGKIMHRFGLFEDNDEEDPEKLLVKTWEAVQTEKTPKVQYEMDIITFYDIAGYEHEQVFLGDTGVARDKEMQPMLLIEARIMSWKYDIGNPRDGSIVLGNILDLSPDHSDIDWVIDKVKEDSGNWDAGGGPITDERFPDIVPNTPQNVSATGLFKKIMLSWTFESTYAIAAYEVYASQINGFVPDPTNLVFRGKVGAYNFDADTDEKWYFRIRAVNTHGTASEYSEQVSASTVQLDLPDIEDIVPDFIEYGIYKGNEAPSPRDYKYWLDTSKEPNLLHHWDETSEAWKPLAPTSADELGAVAVEDYQEQVGQIVSDLTDKVDAEWVDGRLISKANKDDVYTIEQLDNKFDNVVSKTTYEADKDGIITDLESHESRISQTETDIKSKVSNKQYEQDKKSLETSIKENKSSIEQNAESIASKVSSDEYRTDKEGIIKDIRQNKSSIEQNAKSIRSKVDSTYVQGEIGKIEVGGRNLLKGTSDEFATYNHNSTWGDYSPYNDVYGVAGEVYTARIYLKPQADNIKNNELRIRLYGDDVNWRDVVGNKILAGREGYSSVTFTLPEGYNRMKFFAIRFDSKEGSRSIVDYKEAKIEKGNKATDWTPAPEDVEDKINNIQVGGRNLVAKIDVIGWSDGYTFDNYVYRIINKKGAGLRINHDILEPKTEYVMSFRIKKIDGSIKTLGGHMHDMEFMKVYMDGEYVSDNWSSGAMVQYSDDDNEHKVIVHFKTTGTVTDDFYIQPNRASGYAYNYSAEVWDLKVEKGNKATDWTPAPEDTQAKIQSVEKYASEIEQTAKGIKQTVSSLETDYSTFKKEANSTFDQQADQIASKVTEQTYNADMDNMTMRVSKAESSIKQNANNIELKVSKNGVVSSINQSPEQIKISAERVSIDGDLVVKNGKVYIKDGVITNSLIAGDAKIDFAKIANVKVTNAMISSITADKIKSGIIDANKVLIRVKNGTQAIQIDDKGFKSVDSKGKVRIFIGVRDIAGKGQSDPATIIFYGGKGGAAGSIGSNVNDDLIIGSKNGALQFDVKKNMLYYAQEHRFVAGNNNKYWRFLNRKSVDGHLNPIIEPSHSGWGYVGTKPARLWRIYVNYLHYNGLIKLSTRERKENIQDLLPETAQSIFEQINIKRYHYINDDGNSSARKESYGPVAEESPSEILSDEGDALLQDNYINVIAGALKYQQQRIDELEKIIKGESQDGTGS
ncbi:phage tail protein [Virgibacillus pantothenticus]|uniref:phage tail protein n=1 Tax=Virgibacillus pantothenticus TaxID=1473 RepID=UPI002DB5A415|nr:hypothetical protein [Virgibacillus pantothenticus]MEB5452878.1 hypothetical protein [Virgibacillus pantothenticus]